MESTDRAPCSSLMIWVVEFPFFQSQNIPAYVYIDGFQPSSNVCFCNYSCSNIKYHNHLAESGPRIYILATKNALPRFTSIFTFSPFPWQTLLVLALLKTNQEPLRGWATMSPQVVMGKDGSAVNLSVNLGISVPDISHTSVTTGLSMVLCSN